METSDPPRLLWQVHQGQLDLQVLDVFRSTKIPPNGLGGEVGGAKVTTRRP